VVDVGVSNTATLAHDGNGALHAAVVVNNGSGNVLVYSYCTSDCADAGAWQSVAVGTAIPSDFDVPTIVVTADGRPRIMYSTQQSSPPGYHYVECNANCTSASSWTDLQLTHYQPPVWASDRPHMAFATSPDGIVAFASVIVQQSNPAGGTSSLVLWYCRSNCSVLSSWVLRTVDDGDYTDPQAIAFASETDLELLYVRRPTNAVSDMDLFACTGDCSSNGAQLSGIDQLWVATNQSLSVIADLARTPQGASRIVLDSPDPNAASNDPNPPRVYVYLACDTQCGSPSGWGSPVQLPLGNDTGAIGIGIAADSSGAPTVAFLGDLAQGYATCSSSCNASTDWRIVSGVTTDQLNSEFALTVPASCTSASWGMQEGPSVILATSGAPAIAFTGVAKGLGGACGSGSTGDVTKGTFVVNP
jgi:hypothetical protein